MINDPNKDPPKKCLELINTFSNVAGYNINKQKSVAFLYTNDEQPEKNIRKTTSFTIVSKKCW
jgi:hypothetical protein